MGDKAFNILASIVTVALVTTIVTGKNTSAVINALGGAFQGSIRSALGK